MSNSTPTDELDKLLGLPKPLEQLTQQELTVCLARHFPHTRVAGIGEDFLNDPLLKGVANLEELVKQAGKSDFKL